MSGGSSASSNSSALNGGLNRVIVRLNVGHTSERLAHPTPDGHTHRWTVHVRAPGPVQFNDRSLIRKVVFLLHESFNNPVRVVKEPPFQVTETGYGGFMMPIKIHFNGVDKTFTINYDLSLSLVDKFCESNIEHKLELKDPTPEMCALVQKFCPKKKEKESLKEKPTFSKNQFALKSTEKNKSDGGFLSSKSLMNGVKDGVPKERKSSSGEKKRPVAEKAVRKSDIHESPASTSKLLKSIPIAEKTLKPPIPSSSKSTDSTAYNIVVSNNLDLSNSSKTFELPQVKTNAKDGIKNVDNGHKNGDSKPKEKHKKIVEIKSEAFMDSFFATDETKKEWKLGKDFDESIMKKKKKKKDKNKEIENDKDSDVNNKEKRKLDKESKTIVDKERVKKLEKSDKIEGSAKSGETSRPSSSMCDAGEPKKVKKSNEEVLTGSSSKLHKAKRPNDEDAIHEKSKEKKSKQRKLEASMEMKESLIGGDKEEYAEKRKHIEKLEGDFVKKRKRNPLDGGLEQYDKPVGDLPSKKLKTVSDVKTEPNSPYQNGDCEKRPHSSISLPPPFSTSHNNGVSQSPYSVQSSSIHSMTPSTTTQVAASSTRSYEINDDVFENNKYDMGADLEAINGGGVAYDSMRENENLQQQDDCPQTSASLDELHVAYDSEDVELFGSRLDKLRRFNALQKHINSLTESEDELQYRVVDTLLTMDRDVVQYDETLTDVRFKLAYLKKETVLALENVIYNFTPSDNWLEEAQLKWAEKKKIEENGG